MRLRANLKVRRAGSALAAWLLALGSGLSMASAAVINLAGGYVGTGKAAAMAMILDQDEDRIYGRIVDGKNNVFQISGRVNGRAVQGTLSNQTISANFQIELNPSGLKFVIVPMVDGRPDLGAMKQIAFERGRVAHPALADYRAPAPRQGELIDLLVFLENYRSWDRAEVVAGFKGLAEKDRAVIRRYDHLQADLMQRLCQGGAEAAEITSISQGEGVDCARLRALFEGAEEAGILRAFYDRAEIQRAALYAKTACDRNLYAGNRCEPEATAPPRAWHDAGRILAGPDMDARAPAIAPVPASAPPRLAMPRPRAASAGSPARTLPFPPPQMPARNAAPETSSAQDAPSAPAKSGGLVAFFQPKTPAEPQPSESDDLLAALDLKLKPSTAKEQAKLTAPKPSRADGFLERLRAKMRMRPEPAKGTGAKAKGEGITGAAAKVPMPRPRPGT